jgi:hypothetical protein
MNHSYVELQALVVQQHCKVVSAWQTSVCQLKARAHVHAWLCANLDAVHYRLSRCIGSVAVYIEHTSAPCSLQSGAAAETQQVTVRPFRIWCFRCRSYCTAVRCQALALHCTSASHSLLVDHVLGSNCRFCSHMLMHEVRATGLDVV